MGGGGGQALQVFVQVAQLAAFQRQGFQQVERLAGALQKFAFVAPLLPFGVGQRARGNAAANAAAQLV